MQDVRVIGVESGALLLATDQGSEFRLAVTSTLPGQVRQAVPDGAPHKRISPKDVQAKIRGGLDAQQVAEAMGVDVEYVRRFEGPVLAERSFVLDAARRVPVAVTEAGAPDVFGEAIDTRLETGGATGVAWSSWKHPEDGWHVQVRFTADEVEHDAVWRFESKNATLTADNGDAHRLSHADDDEGLTPRLRAVEAAHADSDSTRFDSGAFRVDGSDQAALDPEGPGRPLRAPLPRIGRAPVVEEREPGNETADLLEALRRRRGERESATFADGADTGSGPGTQGERGSQHRSVSVVDVPLASLDDMAGSTDPSDREARPASTPRGAGSADGGSGNTDAGSGSADAGDGRQDRKKRTRRSMPSWDEIVFGTRSDDDLS